jgi:hypothetical protein
VGLGVDLYVVHAVLMYQRELEFGSADRAVAARKLSSAQLGE